MVEVPPLTSQPDPTVMSTVGGGGDGGGVDVDGPQPQLKAVPVLVVDADAAWLVIPLQGVPFGISTVFDSAQTPKH